MKRQTLWKTIRLMGFGLLAGTVGLAGAQGGDCPAIVQQALDATDAVCSQTGRNQACYGNSLIDLQTRANIGPVTFTQPGDVVPVDDVASLRLNPLDAAAGTWGVALMQLQANIPDTLPGQNVTFLLFGDVSLENAVEPDDSSETAMQAFYFHSGIGDAACDQAPNSGILIQTPEGVDQIQLTVNGALLTLGSTAYLQSVAPPEDSGAAPDATDLAVSVLEGEGEIEAYGVREVIPAGSWLRLRMDRDFRASLPPAAALPYTDKRIHGLPLRLLRRAIRVADPLTQDQIDTIRAQFRAAHAPGVEGTAEPGASVPGGIVTLTITNQLRTPAQMIIDGGSPAAITLDFAPGETLTVDIPRGMHAFEVSSAGHSVSFREPILRSVTHNIGRAVFETRRPGSG